MADNQGKDFGLPAWSATATSILNGCIGDYLTHRDNGLAIDMAFHRRGKPLTLTADCLRVEWGMPTRLCVLLHGLCCHEGVWNYPGDPTRSYGKRICVMTLVTTPYFCATTPVCRFPITASCWTDCSRNCCRLSGTVDEIVLDWPQHGRDWCSGRLPFMGPSARRHGSAWSAAASSARCTKARRWKGWPSGEFDTTRRAQSDNSPARRCRQPAQPGIRICATAPCSSRCRWRCCRAVAGERAALPSSPARSPTTPGTWLRDSSAMA